MSSLTSTHLSPSNASLSIVIDTTGIIAQHLQTGPPSRASRQLEPSFVGCASSTQRLTHTQPMVTELDRYAAAGTSRYVRPTQMIADSATPTEEGGVDARLHETRDTMRPSAPPRERAQVGRKDAFTSGGPPTRFFHAAGTV